VVPLSATSIPRLKLIGAVLGLRLALSIAKVLIMQGREKIRDWERECCEYRKRRAKPDNQKMASYQTFD